MKDDWATDVEVRPVAADHVSSFHRALDVVARERRFLTFLEAPPADELRGFLLSGIEKGDPRMVALSHGDVVGWCDTTSAKLARV